MRAVRVLLRNSASVFKNLFTRELAKGKIGLHVCMESGAEILSCYKLCMSQNWGDAWDVGLASHQSCIARAAMPLLYAS